MVVVTSLVRVEVVVAVRVEVKVAVERPTSPTKYPTPDPASIATISRAAVAAFFMPHRVG